MVFFGENAGQCVLQGVQRCPAASCAIVFFGDGAGQCVLQGVLRCPAASCATVFFGANAGQRVLQGVLQRFLVVTALPNLVSFNKFCPNFKIHSDPHRVRHKVWDKF